MLTFKLNAACLTIAIIYAQQVHYIKPYSVSVVLHHWFIEAVRYVTGTSVGCPYP